MSKAEIVALILGSGLLTGVVSGLVALASGKWERQHRTAEREAVAAHESRLRRELAHDNARSEFLKPAQEFAHWAYKYAADAHWDVIGDFIYIGTNEAMPATQEEVLDRLRVIAFGHPTNSVRVLALGLYEDILNAWSEIVGGEIPDPDFDTTVKWHNRSKALIEAIHAPVVD